MSLAPNAGPETPLVAPGPAGSGTASLQPAGDGAYIQRPLPLEAFTGKKPVTAGRSWMHMGSQWSGNDIIFSCQNCGKPVTLRQSMFDKKVLGMWGAALALAVADVEVLESRQCLKAGTCREGNPLLGTTRTQQYAVRLPMLTAAWMSTAWLRKGDQRQHHQGSKYWWIFPTVFQAFSAAGVVSNLKHAR